MSPEGTTPEQGGRRGKYTHTLLNVQMSLCQGAVAVVTQQLTKKETLTPFLLSSDIMSLYHTHTHTSCPQYPSAPWAD